MLNYEEWSKVNPGGSMAAYNEYVRRHKLKIKNVKAVNFPTTGNIVNKMIIEGTSTDDPRTKPLSHSKYGLPPEGGVITIASKKFSKKTLNFPEL
tara:strand:+ start:22147 stop:22431 length:285 start_codon:yes stop_codon:yes gene_type:complete